MENTITTWYVPILSFTGPSNKNNSFAIFINRRQAQAIIFLPVTASFGLKRSIKKFPARDAP